MQLISVGKQASVYLTEEKHVLWVPNQSHRNEYVFVGWRLCRERLSKPHFPEILEISDDGVTMEFVEGLPPKEWNEAQAAQILRELRRANIFHRDVRLCNLVVRSDASWCLLDFGWACDYDDPYPAPWFLGAEGRKARGIQDDTYAMLVIKEALR